jgi:flagellar basal-body rod protein FlgB
MIDPANSSTLQLLTARLQMLGQRQRVIAENVANVSTPGYAPRDVDQEAFAKRMEAAVGVAGGAPRTVMAATAPGHLTAPAGGRAGLSIRSAPDSETTLDGNSVVVEEQMMKIAETRMEFETMVGLYQKSLGLLRLAARSPTR